MFDACCTLTSQNSANDFNARERRKKREKERSRIGRFASNQFNETLMRLPLARRELRFIKFPVPRVSRPTTEESCCYRSRRRAIKDRRIFRTKIAFLFVQTRYSQQSLISNREEKVTREMVYGYCRGYFRITP